jgi:hypothetical protein
VKVGSSTNKDKEQQDKAEEAKKKKKKQQEPRAQETPLKDQVKKD